MAGEDVIADQLTDDLVSKMKISTPANEYDPLNSNTPTLKGGSIKSNASAPPPNPELGRQLQSVPVFNNLPEEERNKLAGAMEKRLFSTKNNTIIQQGSEGDGFFVLIKGTAQVIRKLENGETKLLDVIYEGDYFGEAALITKQVRSASVVATCDCETFFLSRTYFNELFSHGALKNVMFAKRQAITSKMDENEEKIFESKQPKECILGKDASDKTRKLIYKAVKDSALFVGMAEKGIYKVIDNMWKIEIPKTTSVIIQGEMGDNFYVVEKGKFNVYILTQNGVSMKRVDKIVRRECFGELALMYNTPRNATIVSTTSATMWAVDRFTFRSILRNISARQLAEREKFLKAVTMFQPLSNTERAKVAEALDELYFPAGREIVAQEADDAEILDTAMYIIVSGTAKVTRKVTQVTGSGGSEVVEVELSRLTAGQVFGERSLLLSLPRSATVTAIGPVEVLRLCSHAFFLLLSPLLPTLQKQAVVYDTRDAKAAAGEEIVIETTKEEAERKEAGTSGHTQKRPNNALKGRTIHMKNLQIVASLGRGSFGKVHLVKDVTTEETYALKTVNKNILTKPKHQAHIMSEKDMLVKVNSPWIIALYATFKDCNKLYFLLEACLGGELFSLLRIYTCFENHWARYYAAAVVLGFEYMHSLDVVYRDLKPENVMLDSAGYPKIVDLGFATELDSDGRTYTLCGTPAYLSPEIIGGRGYGRGVDWWCLGVFIFELLAGHPPFRSTKHRGNMMKLYERIRAGKYEVPDHMSPEGADIISKFLKLKRHERLGVRASKSQPHLSPEDILKSQDWFRGFDWAALENRTMRAPIIPFIEDNADTSAFNHRDQGEQPHISSRPYNAAGQWDENF